MYSNDSYTLWRNRPKWIFVSIKSLLKKPTMWTHNSYLPFNCNYQEKQLEEDFLESHSIKIRGKFRSRSNISDGYFVLKYSTVQSRYPFCKKLHHDWVLNTSLAMTVARYVERFPIKQKFRLAYLLKQNIHYLFLTMAVPTKWMMERVKRNDVVLRKSNPKFSWICRRGLNSLPTKNAPLYFQGSSVII